MTYFERFCQIFRENFDWLTSYCDFVRGVPKKSKRILFSIFSIFFFFSKQAFLQNVLSIHYVEVVNMIFLLVFKYKYIRIGNFVVFSIRKYGTYFRYIFLFTL